MYTKFYGIWYTFTDKIIANTRSLSINIKRSIKIYIKFMKIGVYCMHTLDKSINKFHHHWLSYGQVWLTDFQLILGSKPIIHFIACLATLENSWKVRFLPFSFPLSQYRLLLLGSLSYMRWELDTYFDAYLYIYIYNSCCWGFVTV